MPTQEATIGPEQAALALLDDLSDEDLVGQVLMPSVSLSTDPAQVAALVADYRLGGLILSGDVRNTAAGSSASSVRALTDAVRTASAQAGIAPGTEPLLGVDQEYGWVTRIKTGIVQLPAAMAFGAAARPDLTEAAWHGAGAELAAAGINVNFAPDADVVSTGNQAIGSRSFGSDPAIASAQVAAAVRGLQAAGVAATVKHFPGHGNTTVDSHESLPVLSQSRDQLRARDLAPFQAGIDAGAWLVMSGHLDVKAIDAGVPASLSSKVLIDLLRNEMGFDGVVVTDGLNMGALKRWSASQVALRALLAGNDLLLMPAREGGNADLGEIRDSLLAALADGSLPRERLREAVTRVLTLKFRLAGFSRPEPSTVDAPENRDAALAVAAAAITVLKGPCTGPLVSAPVRVTASGGRDQARTWLEEALREQGVPLDAGGDPSAKVVHLVGWGDSRGDLRSGAAVTVAMDTPYILREATSPVLVATYSSSQVSMRALAAVIAGTASAPGRLPVAVSGLPASACAA